MAARSRRPWLSVVLGLVLGFTVASWLIAPKVAELSERKRRGGGSGNSGSSGGGGGGSKREQPPPPPAAEDEPVPSPPVADTGEGDPQEEEEEEEDGAGRHGSSHNGSGDYAGAPGCAKTRHFLYVGVMTAQKYLGSRALAVQRTWARSISGRVEFFSSQGSVPPPALQGEQPLPVVALPGVDDSYPPQKKSFMMLKYMHDHYLDTYEWFMRADDDVYIKGQSRECVGVLFAMPKLVQCLCLVL
uniref:Fringe-like glycosyltransferase domain-containing protein n=1 Tax=Varanus komodoensis TaxID=61221 RepID=A0A8D2JJW1_VARKO